MNEKQVEKILESLKEKIINYSKPSSSLLKQDAKKFIVDPQYTGNQSFLSSMNVRSSI